MSDRKMAYVTVLEADKYVRPSERKWPPTNLRDFVAWAGSILDDIPAEFRDKAGIEIDAESDYEDSTMPIVRIGYWRPETDAEMSQREANAKAWRERDERAEREAYERLKAKFESTPNS